MATRAGARAAAPVARARARPRAAPIPIPIPVERVGRRALRIRGVSAEVQRHSAVGVDALHGRGDPALPRLGEVLDLLAHTLDVAEFVHEYENPVGSDVLGEVEAIIFNQIDAGEQFYATGLRVIAEDAEGNEVETALPISVHRPIEVIHSGKRLLAERYTPVPVSGCMPGSVDTMVRYSETRTEFRQSSVNFTLRSEWSSSNGTTRSETW